MFHPSRIAAAALLAALPVVGVAATAAPAQAASPVPQQHQPKDGPDDGPLGDSGGGLFGGGSDEGGGLAGLG
ncbi:hypothetical protein [Streptomyces noursei]|uniref:Uncharacterized protein n=1 Tax=Streptomyces noursei TaxID=1971 RepID=A0A2N8P7Q6_STRNR|nr:hypothetical protein [Streptomyces noursei]PNE37054.1 hypothetical protein AOB60_21820 [Streptomyces noursei]